METEPPVFTSQGMSPNSQAGLVGTFQPAPIPDLNDLTAWKAQRLRQLFGALASRRAEGLSLYEPLPVQQAFHECNVPERIVRGGNRSGKTLSACCEIARAVTGRDPHKKYPKDGTAILVGFDGKHLAEVFYKNLFRPGAFKMIRDARTKLWRSYRPWEEEDRLRDKETKPAPPLIPRRYIREIAWENRKANVPQVVRLTTGWDMHFISGNAEPPQGWKVDLVAFDEEIAREDFYTEMAPRLADRAGKFIWSATPQAATDALYRLHERAEESDPNVKEFLVMLDDNPHIATKEKQILFSKWTEEERLVRYYGEYAKNRYRVYPEFNLLLHGVDYFQIPNDWCRYMVVDPGRQVCACLFAAVPPPDVGDYLYLYDELYIENCDADIFGQRVAQATEGQTFRDFIIDWHGSRIHDTGGGLNVGQQYSEALKRYKVFCQVNKNGFTWGSDDIEAGILAARRLLRDRGGDQGPKLRVLRGKLKNFETEMKRYHYKREKDGSVSERTEQRGIHLLDDLRYLAMYDPRYHKPRPPKKPDSFAVRYLKEKRARHKQRDGADGISLG